MLNDIWLVYLISVNFLKKNIFVLIPFYIVHSLFWFSEENRYWIGVSFVLFLFLYSYVAIIIYETHNEMGVRVYQWSVVLKSTLNTVLLFLLNFFPIIVGAFLLGLISFFTPEIIINILSFVLTINVFLSFVFGVFVISFSNNTTPVEALILGIKSFYKNFFFYFGVIVIGVLVLTLYVIIVILMNLNSLDLLVGPILNALQVTSLAFAFWQKNQNKKSLHTT